MENNNAKIDSISLTFHVGSDLLEEDLLDFPLGRSSQIFFFFLLKMSIFLSFLFIVFTFNINFQFSSVQFSRSVVSNSLRHHDRSTARPPCPSPTPGVYSNSCPWIRWCHPAISSSVIPFYSCPHSLPASGSFPMSQLFAWGGQSIGVSASASVLPKLTLWR